MSLGFLYYKLWTHLVQYEHMILVFLFRLGASICMLNWIYYWLKVNLNQVTFWIRRKLKVHQTFRGRARFQANVKPMWGPFKVNIPFSHLKISENHRFSDIFRCEKGTLTSCFQGYKKGNIGLKWVNLRAQ